MDLQLIRPAGALARRAPAASPADSGQPELVGMTGRDYRFAPPQASQGQSPRSSRKL